jgi:hypothetical protein
VWKPFMDAYYSSHPWPAAWKAPFGIVTHEVCKYDGGLVATGGYNEIFMKGVDEPNYQCGGNPYPGETPYVAPIPSPLPAPSPSPSH